MRGRAIVLTSSEGHFGGVERHAVNLTRALREAGLECRCIFPDGPNAVRLLHWCQDQGVEAESTGAFRISETDHPLRESLALARMIRSWHPNLVSLNYPSYPSIKDVAAVRLAGVRCTTVTIHSLADLIEIGPRKQRITALVSRVVPFVAHSEAVAERLRENRVPQRRIYRVPMGFSPVANPPTRAEARRRWGLPENAFVVGVHARLTEVKGVSNVVAALGAMNVGPDGPHLLVAGDGPLRDEIARQTKIHLADRGHLLGQVANSDLASFYSALDVFSMAPNCKEAFGIVFIEAAQLGVPSVTWRTGGVTEAVLADETGLVVANGDVSELTDALTRLRCDPDLRIRMGIRARERAETEFNSARMAVGYLRAAGGRLSRF